MYKILVLTDFSAASKHAIAFTQALFADTATDFCLLHTFPLQPEVGYSGVFLLAEQRESAEKSLQALQYTIREQPVPDYHTYRTLVIPGSPERAVEELLTQEHFDLVVTGATGFGRSELVGSVATGMIRSAKTNVLVIPATAPIRPLEHVVLATDYRSVNDTESFDILNDLASRKGAQLTLLTIENPQQHTPPVSDLSRQYVVSAFENLQTDTYTIHDENVLQGINSYLDIHTVDMLVMLPHHKSFFDVLRNKSVARSVAYHPRVPLLALYDSVTATPVDKPTSELETTPFASYL
ncbi:hypothetical protein GCM10028808_07930 [Spirosoma migulaei]